MTQEQRVAAEATFVKKRIFYGMRAKALAAQVDAAKRRARRGVDRRLEAWYTELKPAVQHALALKHGVAGEGSAVAAKVAALAAAEQGVHADAATMKVRLQSGIMSATKHSARLLFPSR